jgi:hypothetical protein
VVALLFFSCQRKIEIHPLWIKIKEKVTEFEEWG